MRLGRQLPEYYDARKTEGRCDLSRKYGQLRADNVPDSSSGKRYDAGYEAVLNASRPGGGWSKRAKGFLAIDFHPAGQFCMGVV